MATLAPGQAIDAPARVPLPYGLFSAVTPVEAPFPMWEQGAQWLDQPCEPLAPVIGSDCLTPTGLPLDLESELAPGLTDTFTVYGEFDCSPVGFPGNRGQEMASARLFAREEQAVTSHLLTLLTTATPLAGQELLPPIGVDALPALELFLATQYGSQGVIIVTLDFLYQATEARAIERVSNGLRTVGGTPVVLDRTGTDTAASIVPMPLLYRGAVFGTSSRDADMLNRANNTLLATAMRTYVLGWVPCGGAYVNLA